MPADSLSLAGKVAIVTGSGRENGIGAAIARALARNGASVTIHYVSDNSARRARQVAQSIRDEYRVNVALIQGDISTAKGAQKIVTDTMEKLKVNRVDILVNNAAYGVTTLLREATFEEIQRTFSTNVYGQVFMTQAVVDLGRMPPGGRIINIGSIASKMGPTLTALYAASKAAQDSLTTSWAGELGRSHGITVNTIAPGPVATDMCKGAPEVIEPMLPLQRGSERYGSPDDVADAVLLLTSERSRWITGQFIAADAGIIGTM